MGVVFVEKSICVLIAGGGCEGKTRFEDVAGLKKFVGDGVGCGNWSGPKFGEKMVVEVVAVDYYYYYYRQD